MSSEIIEVAAGLLFRSRRLLIAQRPPTGHLANLWEFPGGKREADESFEACLRREFLEELGITIEALACLSEVRHSYPDNTVFVRFFKCRWLAGKPQALGCQAVQWITVKELNRFAFPAADARLLEQLRKSPDWWD